MVDEPHARRVIPPPRARAEGGEEWSPVLLAEWAELRLAE